MARQGICETDNAKLFMLKWALIVVNILFWVSNELHIHCLY